MTGLWGLVASPWQRGAAVCSAAAPSALLLCRQHPCMPCPGAWAAGAARAGTAWLAAPQPQLDGHSRHLAAQLLYPYLISSTNIYEDQIEAELHPWRNFLWVWIQTPPSAHRCGSLGREWCWCQASQGLRQNDRLSLSFSEGAVHSTVHKAIDLHCLHIRACIWIEEMILWFQQHISMLPFQGMFMFYWDFVKACFKLHCRLLLCYVGIYVHKLF